MSRLRAQSKDQMPDVTMDELQAQNAELQKQLEEAQETLLAIRDGSVDAFVVKDTVYTLTGADRPYRLFVEEMQQAAATLGADGTILYCNRQFANLLNASHENIIGMNLRALVAAEDREKCLLHSGKIEVRLLQDENELIPVILAFNVLPEDCGAATGVLVTDLRAQRDNEELKIAYQKLAESNEEREKLLESERAARTEAERSTRMKEEFLSLVSHELRTPLNAILGWSQLMKRTNDPEAHRQGLEAIERGARSQAMLIDELLDVSRIVSGKLRIEVQSLQLSPLVTAAIETLRPAAEAKSIQVQQMVSPDASPVKGDPARIQQIVWNLLSNAIKFTPKGGIVQILVTRTEGHVEITVIDTGSGISEKFLPHVFERFLQADSSMSRTHGGLGLGLAIVKHLVELHGGTVSAESDGEGKGATFRVRLPLDRSKATDAAMPHELGLTPLPNVKVLVVDDDPSSCEVVRRILVSCEAEVSCAASVEEALPLLEKFLPDVLISDIGMPGKDGIAFIREIRETEFKNRTRRLPAVALTAFARAEDRIRVLQAGYNSHVSKPIDPRELIAVVESLATGK
jgi:signal transduction histidine kinase/ActR/RegA family two-component response regulator